MPKRPDRRLARASIGEARNEKVEVLTYSSCAFSFSDKKGQAASRGTADSIGEARNEKVEFLYTTLPVLFRSPIRGRGG